ncbi:uncharacterized protein SRCM101294_01277 [Bacillus amyloliquefaciens]|uniref:hypothetical protein n=1 Tax=Bacillus amyloliquefaciens TaxID=1390 RepID=UPI00080C554C|nr:hypothetical protein [Bacillus amyloliquefaciens]MCZ4247234.1 hypothetical protein [Bacillus amyloliquefaciens]MEC3840535.1 hypothetical protein [Bacillus amyloliquefaciens]OCB97089.1 uncharacterized protein SRCM101294_01277 [Bacillus amyloliquefaciens]QBG55434.1 hypothetical protein D2M30_1103 [Bacillus amyloliquefaciens]
MKKIIAFIVVIALLVIAFFYVYSRTGDVFTSSNADLIILSEHGKKEIKIKDRQNVKDMLDILNQGKQVKLTKSVSPDYDGTVKYHEDRFDSFSMWLENGNYMLYKYKNTYYKLTRHDTKLVQSIIKEESQS